MARRKRNISKSSWKYVGILVLGILFMVGSVGKMVLAEGAIADETTPRKITITKYQTTALNDVGEPGNGQNVEIENALVQGVEFTVQKVQPVEVDGKKVQLTDPTDPKQSKAYTLIDGTTQTGVTDNKGQIVFDLGKGTSVDGIYLVTETDTTNAKDAEGKPITIVTPTNPFFVYVPQTSRENRDDLIYDVHVQPKNVVKNDLKPSKTIQDQPGYSNVAGNSFQWELTTNVPVGLYPIATQDIAVAIVDEAGNQLYNLDKSPAYVNFKKDEPIYVKPEGTYYDTNGKKTPAATVSRYSITDTLDSNLKYEGATVWVQNKAGEYQLAKNDYEVTYDDQNKQFTMELTEDGIREIGSGKITDNVGNTITGPFDKISTHISTNVNPGFNGNIPNNFEVTYQTPGGKPITQEPPTKPQYYTGGFDILKQDEETQDKLASAEFHLATNEDDAKTGKFLATDGNSYLEKDLPKDVEFLKATSDAEGKASFNGLPLVWESVNNSSEVQIGANGLPIEGNTIEKKYYVVETKAPAGYELLKTPEKVTVTLGTKGTVLLTVDNKKATDLPFTGGAGTALVISIALGALTLGTVLMVINKKRQAD